MGGGEESKLVNILFRGNKVAFELRREVPIYFNFGAGVCDLYFHRDI